MDRLYKNIIEEHFKVNEQMLLLAGPWQVGKTTLAKSLQQMTQCYTYLNFDREKDRFIIMQGEDSILEKIEFHTITETEPLLILDEFHKYKHWKSFLKGFYDQYKGKINIVVTGSAKLDVYQKGVDSLMGRYLLYRIHPLTVAELLKQPFKNLINPPKQISKELLDQLIQFGGYPEPFIKNNKRFSVQWRQLRRKQLFVEDIRSLTQVQDIAHIEMLALLLKNQVGQQINYSNLAKSVRVSVDTIRRWINILEEFYYCFRLQPWHKNVKRSILKEPKIFLWDWAEIKGRGARIENFVACHLHKAVHFWTDYGFGEFNLYYLRDKEKREVDFLVTKDNEPWFLVEVKNSDSHSLSKNLCYFKEQINAPHAFQLALNKSFVNKDCFSYYDPIIAPLITFLSQLV